MDNIIQRFEGCVGIRLFRTRKFNVELWYIPPRFRIKEHYHPNMDIEILYLWGDTTFYRNDNKKKEYLAFNTTWRNMFKLFTIKHYHSHYLCNFSKPLIFINFSKWIRNSKPQSASIDIEFSKEDYAKETA